ncbi:MAG: PilW family protein [Gammaproteobacteria bacterium]
MKNSSMQKGFSVIELMVALLLGLFLVSGVTAMYISSKQTYRMTDNLARIQESLRYSVEFISRDIRMAGYLPCRFPPIVNNAVTNGTSTWFLDFFNSGIRGYEGGSSTFPTEISSDVVAGSDAVAILKGGLYSMSVGLLDDSTNTFTVQGSFPSNEFQQGEIAIACDPRQASLFQIQNSSPGNSTTDGTISFANNTNIAPGNTTTAIGSYGDDAQITPYEPVIYFVAPSTQDPTVNSLKKRYLQARLSGGNQTAVMWEEELIEGVESMQILYGLDINNDQIADRFETAATIAATEWLNVISVRLGLLMATGDEVVTQADTGTYNVAGTLISDSSIPAHGGDRRLRYVVNTTINLRNRVAN